jgi:Rrf2 family protein
MVELAELAKTGPISLRSIAQRRNLSEHYLGQVVPDLRKNGLIKSIRGAQGGYILAKDANKIKVGDIIRALEGPIAPVECGREDSTTCCEEMEYCATRSVWQKVQEAVNGVVDSITLQELVDESKAALA